MKKVFLFLLLWMLLFAVKGAGQSSLTFNGSSNYVNITNDAALHLKSFTLEAWIKTNGLGVTATSGSGGITAYPIITKGRGEADAPSNLNMNYFLGLDANRKLTADFEEAAGANHPVLGNAVIPDNVWTHIAVTYEPVNAVWKLYINGVLDITKDVGSNKVPADVSIQPAAIGSALDSKSAAAGYFKGSMDEVRIWNVVRTDAEILNNYKTELTSGTGLVARYGLNEGAGTTAKNTIATASNGTLKNSPQWNSTGFGLSTSNQALSFNGTTNYVNLTNNAALRLQRFTLEGWVKIQGSGATTGTGGFAASTVVPIIAKGRRSSGTAKDSINYFLGYRASDMKLVADFQDNSTGASHPVVSKGVLPSCNWVHVAATYNSITDTFYKKRVDTSFKNRTDTSFKNRTDTTFKSRTDTSYKNRIDSSFKSRIDTSFKSQTDTSFSNRIDTSFNNRMDTSFANRVDTSFNTHTDTLITPPADTSYSTRIDTIYTNRTDTLYTNRTDTVYTPKVDTSYTNRIDTVLTNRIDTVYTNKIDTVFTNRMDTIFTNRIDTLFKNRTDTLLTNRTDTLFNKTGLWKLYVNGKKDTTLAVLVGTIPQSLGNIPTTIGSSLSSGGVAQGFFNGKMDEVRLWNVVRSDAEILSNYQLELNKGSGLIASYSLNEGSGTTAANAIASSGNATLVNNPQWTKGFNNLSNDAIRFNGSSDYISLGVANGTSGTQNLNLTAFTLEAWVKMQGTGVTTQTSSSGGITAYPVITKGRSEADAPANVNLNYFLGIDQNKKLTADFEESGGANHPVVGSTTIPDSAWTHVAVTYEPVSAVWKLYVNGKLDATKDLGSNITPVSTSIEYAAIASAMDSKGAAAGFFKGNIDEVRIWNVVRSDTAIANNFKKELTSGTGLIARWGFNELCTTAIPNSIASAGAGAFSGASLPSTSGFSLPPNVPANPSPATNASITTTTVNLCTTVSDPENNKLRVRYYGRKKATSSTKFTIILVPDTQFYVAEPQGKNKAYNTMYKAQTKWIADNRASKNIAYVAGLGDCVDQGDSFEVSWKRVDTAIKTIESPALTGLTQGIPYGMCVGNHDQSPRGNPKGTTTFFNKYFGYSRYSGRTYYGGHFSTNNDNHYDLFSAGGIDFLVIYFEYDETTGFTVAGGALDWGESLIKKYPSRKVIVVTHYSIAGDTSFSNLGKAVYNRFKVYKNFIFFFGGHVVDATGEARRMDTYNGNTVYTTMQDYQGRTNGGNGLLRIYTFDPQNNKVAVQTYSPYTNTYETDANSQFNLSVHLTDSVKPSAYALLGEVNNVTSGSSVCVNWPSLAANAGYEWYADVYDNDNKITSPTWSFSTSATAASISASPLWEQNPIAEPPAKAAFTMYPNPNSTNELTLSFFKEMNGPVQIEIYDVAGRVQFRKEFDNISQSIQLRHNLSAGTYVVVVKTENKRETKKLMVIK